MTSAIQVMETMGTSELLCTSRKLDIRGASHPEGSHLVWRQGALRNRCRSQVGKCAARVRNEMHIAQRGAQAGSQQPRRLNSAAGDEETVCT